MLYRALYEEKMLHLWLQILPYVFQGREFTEFTTVATRSQSQVSQEEATEMVRDQEEPKLIHVKTKFQ